MEVPPEKTREFLQTILFIIKSMRREKGCLGYHFYHDMEDENKFRLVGKWEKQEDMDNLLFLLEEALPDIKVFLDKMAKKILNHVSYLTLPWGYKVEWKTDRQMDARSLLSAAGGIISKIPFARGRCAGRHCAVKLLSMKIWGWVAL